MKLALMDAAGPFAYANLGLLVWQIDGDQFRCLSMIQFTVERDATLAYMAITDDLKNVVRPIYMYGFPASDLKKGQNYALNPGDFSFQAIGLAPLDKIIGEHNLMLNYLKEQFANKGCRGGLTSDWDLIHEIDPKWENPWRDKSQIKTAEQAYALYDQGVMARSSKKTASTPYEEGSDSHKIWNAGWCGHPISFEVEPDQFINLHPDYRGLNRRAAERVEAEKYRGNFGETAYDRLQKLRDTANELREVKGRALAMKFIQSFGATRLADLDPRHYDAFIQAAKARLLSTIKTKADALRIYDEGWRETGVYPKGSEELEVWTAGFHRTRGVYLFDDGPLQLHPDYEDRS